MGYVRQQALCKHTENKNPKEKQRIWLQSVCLYMLVHNVLTKSHIHTYTHTSPFAFLDG